MILSPGACAVSGSAWSRAGWLLHHGFLVADAAGGGHAPLQGVSVSEERGVRGRAPRHGGREVGVPRYDRQAALAREEGGQRPRGAAVHAGGGSEARGGDLVRVRVRVRVSLVRGKVRVRVRVLVRGSSSVSPKTAARTSDEPSAPMVAVALRVATVPFARRPSTAG
jgi:hypothetical protein